MRNIVVNGKSYSNIDDMPPEIRKIYQETMGIFADKDGNGIPDLVEGKSETNINIIPVHAGEATIINADGRIYTNISELPPEAQEKYKLAMGKLSQVLGDKNQNGIPDLLENSKSAAIKTDISTITVKGVDFQKPSLPIITSVAEDKPYYKGFIIFGVLLALVIGLVLLGIIIYIIIFGNNYARFNL
jgi:hypothetical protein